MPPTRPTTEEIQRQIEWLEAMKPHIPHYGAYNEDRHGEIDAGIAVLRGDLSYEQIDEEYAGSENVQAYASSCRAWLDGDASDDFDPAGDYAGLCEKKHVPETLCKHMDEQAEAAADE